MQCSYRNEARALSFLHVPSGDLRKAVEKRKRPPTAARENDASKNSTDWDTVIGQGQQDQNL